MAITLPDDMRLDALRDTDLGANPLDRSGAPDDDTTTGPVLGRKSPVVTGFSPDTLQDVKSTGPTTPLPNEETAAISEQYFDDLSTELQEGGPALTNKLVDPADSTLKGPALDAARAAFADGVQDDLQNLVIKEALTSKAKAALIAEGASLYEGKNFDLVLGKMGEQNELYVDENLTQDELAAVLQDASELIFEVNAQEQGLTLNQDAFDEFIAGFTETFFVSLSLDVRVEADNADVKQEENLARIARETLMLTRTVQ
ncbi:MAG: hypothetical protein ABJN14_02315 [Paracoccaceae bacterium]